MSDDVSIPNSSYSARRSNRHGGGRVSIGPDNRRLLLYAGGLGGILIAMVTASTLTGRHSGPLPVVEADSRPIRVKPENPGGMRIDAADSDVFSGGSGTANAQLAPPAEAPNPNGIQTAAKPKPATLAPPAAAPAKVAVTAPEPAPAVKAAPAATKAPAAAATPATAAKPTVVASALPAPAAAKPAVPAPHAAAVQLAAMTSEAAAKEEWQKLQHQMPDVFGSRQPTIAKTERDGRTYWRLRTTGFTDVAQARTFCEKVRGKGGSCSVADF